MKVPRLKDKYEFLLALGTTEEQARQRAEQKLYLERHVYNPLDISIEVLGVSDSGYPYEAHLRYLHPRYEKELTEVERRRIKGNLTKLLIADKNDELTPFNVEAYIQALKKTELYDITSCADPQDIIPTIIAQTPELLLLKHNLPAFDAPEILKEIRQTGIQQPTIVYGRNLDRDSSFDTYFKHREVLYYINIPRPDQIVETVEKAVNGVRAKNKEMFYIP